VEKFRESLLLSNAVGALKKENIKTINKNYKIQQPFTVQLERETKIIHN